MNRQAGCSRASYRGGCIDPDVLTSRTSTWERVTLIANTNYNQVVGGMSPGIGKLTIDGAELEVWTDQDDMNFLLVPQEYRNLSATIRLQITSDKAPPSSPPHTRRILSTNRMPRGTTSSLLPASTFRSPRSGVLSGPLHRAHYRDALPSQLNPCDSLDSRGGQ
jgi:hypothetical protein